MSRPKIAFFLEDLAQERLITALVLRMAAESGLTVQYNVFNATGGKGRVLSELKRYLNDFEKGNKTGLPDVLIVAIDANCKGVNTRRKEIHAAIPESFSGLTVYAIPNPHIERWMLIDSAAFRMAMGKGCSAPKQKCDKDRYKILLANAVHEAGLVPLLGGLEHADTIVENMDINATMNADKSFKHFIDQLRNQFNRLKANE